MSVKAIPKVKNITGLGKDALVAGGIGGLARGIGMIFLGPLGDGLGGIIGGSMVGGVPGTIIAVSAVSDALRGITAGLAGQVMGGFGRGGGGGGGANNSVM